MASILRNLKPCFFLRPALPNMAPPVRQKWADWRMIKDVKRRRCVKQYYFERVCLNAVRRNDILPPQLQEVATVDINAQPRDARVLHLTKRCAMTSRGRGCVIDFRLSRIVWRHLADYNKLAGVQRAMW